MYCKVTLRKPLMVAENDRRYFLTFANTSEKINVFVFSRFRVSVFFRQLRWET